jgi:tRNA(Ile)-lysidine synthase
LDASEVNVKQFFKTKDAFVEWFDADTISGSLIICRRQDGDRFRPIGAPGEKKVGRFLIDAQLDHAAKLRAFIVKDAERILWLAPIRMSENAKLTSKSRKIIEIKVHQIKP